MNQSTRSLGPSKPDPEFPLAEAPTDHLSRKVASQLTDSQL